MVSAVRAGIVYFAVVFAAGFVLGTIRTLILLPRVGELTAVLIELPFMLAISWAACGFVARRWLPQGKGRDALAMGGVAFVLLMAAEWALSVALFSRSLAEHFEALGTPAGAAGIAGQALFALIPLARIRR